MPYAFKLMSGEKLFGRNLRLQAKGCNLDGQFSNANMRKTKSYPSGIAFERRNRQQDNPSIMGNDRTMVDPQYLNCPPSQLNKNCSLTYSSQQTFDSNRCTKFPHLSNYNGIFDPDIERRMQERLQMIAQPGQYQQAMFLQCGPPSNQAMWMHTFYG